MAVEIHESVYNLVDFNTAECKKGNDYVFQMDLLSIVSETLAEMAELKDKETGNHIKRVAIIGEMIAIKLNETDRIPLSQEFIQLLRYSIPLHDIGKVGVADEILLKNGGLTQEEFAIMKMHSTIGAHILSNLHERIKGYDISYFNMAANIARYHHERYDGSGYPEGLQGNEIPIEAQITALVDILDALMSKRPYKEAYSLTRSLEIIKDGTGTHFNPVLVEILLENIERLEEIYGLLKD